MNKNKLLHLSIFTGLTAVAIYGINKSINVLANAKLTLSNPHGRKFEWRFGNVFYTKQGEGKPILLIHDLTCGSSAAEWNSLVNKYAKTNTVYTIDLIGCGRSDKPKITYTNYLYVQLITDFIKNIICHRTDVIVTGESASFVLMACYNDDTLFDKILLINPTSKFLNNHIISNNQKILKFLIEAPLIGTLIYNISNMKKSYEKQFKEEYFNNPYAIRSSMIKSYYDASHCGTPSKHLFASISSNYTGISISHALKKINNSIFIIGSEFEPNVYETISDYEELNPSIEHVILDGTKHLPQLEKSDELLSLIKIFIA